MLHLGHFSVPGIPRLFRVSPSQEPRTPCFNWSAENRDRKRGHYCQGVFLLEEPLESLQSSRISRKWSDSPLFSTVWGFSKISRISKSSRISRQWACLKRPLFQKTPFPNPRKGVPPLWSQLRRWFTSDRPALIWPALGVLEGKGVKVSVAIFPSSGGGV